MYEGERLQEVLEEVTSVIKDSKEELDRRRPTNYLNQIDRRQPTSQELHEKVRTFTFDETKIRAAIDQDRQQRAIISQDIDIEVLVHALKKFKNLQQIRLMPVVSSGEVNWPRFLSDRGRAELATEFSNAQWVDAYEHAVSSLAFAVRKSGSKATRFSSRFMQPRMPLQLKPRIRDNITILAARLSCLELQLVDDRADLDTKMLQLSELFKIVFRALNNLQSLHIGL
jgi:hypothetical protein